MKKLAELSESEPRKRGPGRPIPKGTTLNPGGQSKEKRDLLEALKGEGETVHAALMDLVRHGNAQAIIYAHTQLAGKPKDRVEISGPNGKTLKVGIYDLTRLSDDKVRQLEETLGEAAVDDSPKP